MAKLSNSCFLDIFIINIVVIGFQVFAVPYDCTFTHECLVKPLGPQYDGGMVINPELDEGLKGWTSLGDAKLEHAQSMDGNKYIVASNRKQPFHSFMQKFNLEKEKLYTFSAWLQVSHGSADIAAIFKTESTYITTGWVTGQAGCWSMLKGGLVVNTSGPAELYFQSKNADLDIWADSISLQPFTHQEWKSHQDQSIEKVRKRRVKFQVVDRTGKTIPNATISLQQNRAAFPFGCAMNQYILRNPAYQNWFTSRFKYTVFENELKWPTNERSRGSEDYSAADALVAFAKSHGISVRGHNVFWADQKFQPSWDLGLSSNDLWASANKRITSVMSRYWGKFFHWDVMNENMHFSFFESKLGPNASAIFYQKANNIDRKTTPFLNEYNTVEESADGEASPAKYLQRIRQIRRQGYKGPLGIGVEGHFHYANLPYIRASLDWLASAKLPIWVTELDVIPGPNQATYLHQVLREVHSHWAVQGILLWAAWSPQGCYRMCLTDNNFRNLATGDVVDKFRFRLTNASDSPGTTDPNGFFETSLYHGEYEARIRSLNGDEISDLQKFEVVSNEEQEHFFYFKV